MSSLPMVKSGRPSRLFHNLYAFVLFGSRIRLSARRQAETSRHAFGALLLECTFIWPIRRPHIAITQLTL